VRCGVVAVGDLLRRRCRRLAANIVTVNGTVATSERLRLRRWEIRDAETLHAICSDDAVVRYLGGRPWTSADAESFVEDMRSRAASGSPETWAVEELGTAELIGWCGFARTNAPWLRSDFVIEIGWTLARTRWGQGLATEAAHVALGLGRRLHDASRVVSKCHEANAASERVMQRIGMTQVGIVKGGTSKTLLYRF
jgi:ribosomal-protein-alanine N-acetyltransferase